MSTVRKVYFAPGDTWQTEDASIVWVDITSKVHNPAGLTITRGRSSENEQSRTGTCSFTLLNSDRLFDPMYSSGTYYGELVPGVPVKVEATVNGSDVEVFRGFINGWPQDYDRSNNLAMVQITATDGLGKLALAKLPSSVYAIEVAADAPDLWYRCAETGGTEMGDAAGSRDGAYSSPVASASDHPNTYETVGAVEFSDDTTGSYAPVLTPAFPFTIEATFVMSGNSSGPLFYLGDGVSAFAYLVTTAGTVVVAGIYVGSNEYFISNTVALAVGDHLHVVASFTNSTTAAFYINGVEVSTTVSSAGVPVLFSGVSIGGGFGQYHEGAIADAAYYDTNLSGARCAVHGLAFAAPWDGDTTGERAARLLDVADWPSDLRDLATGFTTLGPAVLGSTALDQLRKLEASEQGRLFISRDGKLTLHDRYYSQLVTAGSTSQVTFSDDGSDIPYTSLGFDYDDRFVFGRIEASTSGGYSYTVENAASLTAYGDKTDTSLNGLDVDPATLRALAEHRLLTYKQPALRPRPITVALHSADISDAEAETLLELDLGHRVTIERTPQGVGSAISQEAVIESISHRVNAKEWHITFALSPAPITDYGLWGDDWDTATWGP